MVEPHVDVIDSVAEETGGSTTRPAAGARTVVPFAGVAVLSIAGALGVLLVATSGQYGYFGDELYFLVAGHHLDWSYVDQPPLLPLVARLMDFLAPGSLVALRIPAMLSAVGVVVLAALTAREFGGGRRAQVIAAATAAVAPEFLAVGHSLSTATIDPLLWAVVVWLVVRWTRLRQDGLLLWAGLATAVDLQAKYLILGLWAVMLVAVLAFGPRDLLRRPMLWLGALISVLTSVPALWWQAANGWPQVKMGSLIAKFDAEHLGTGVFLFLLVAGCGFVGAALLLYGTWWLLRQPTYRFLGVTFLGVVALFLITNGRSYYVLGLAPALWAAAAVGLDRVRGRWLPVVAWPVYAVVAAMGVVTLPLAPVDSLRGVSAGSEGNVASVGWPEMVDDAAKAYHALSPADQARTAVVGADYMVASALARFGSDDGLPTPYSPNRGYWYFGTPPENASLALVVGGTVGDWQRYFGKVDQVGTIDNGLGVNTDYQGTGIWLCDQSRAPWSTLWPRMRNL